MGEGEGEGEGEMFESLSAVEGDSVLDCVPEVGLQQWVEWLVAKAESTCCCLLRHRARFFFLFFSVIVVERKRSDDQLPMEPLISRQSGCR